MTENQKDILLLQSDPGKLVVKYQDTIEIIVQKRMINTGFYPYQEKEELCQEVSIRILEKAEEIKKQYDDKRALFITFFSLKVINCCYEILRGKKRIPEHVSLPDSVFSFSNGQYSTEKEVHLQDEYKKFEAILKMYYRKRAKVELCLQIVYRIRVLMVYFINYCKKTAKSFYAAVTEMLPLTKEFSRKEIFHIITPYLNKSENKHNSEIAAQRWLNNIINDSIVQMNLGIEPEVYNKEIFQELVEHYFYFKNEKENSIIESKVHI